MSAVVDVKRELHACAAIARHAGQARANRGSSKMIRILLALAIAAPLVAGAITGKWARSIGFGAGLPLIALTANWWVLMLLSMADQNRPQARLVPGIGRRSALVLGIAWAAVTLVMTVVLTLADLDALPAALAVALILAVASAWLLLPAFGWGLYLLVMIPAVFGERLKAMLPFSSLQMLRWGGPLLILFLGQAVLRALYNGLPQRPHFAVVIARRATLIDRLLPAFAKRKPGVPSPYARRLQRDCARRALPALLVHGIGPAAFAPSLKFLLQATVVVAALVLVVPGLAGEYRMGLRAIIPALMVALQVMTVTSMVEAVYRSRGEQALLRLAAAMPRSSLLNGVLGRQLLLGYALCWLGSSAFAIAVLYAAGVSWDALLRILAVFLMTLGGGGLLLRDYASQHDAKGSSGMRIMVMLVACVLVLIAPAGMFRVQPWLVAGVGMLGAGLMLGWYRWNRMLRAAAAFPAARNQ